jgi:Rrf2 family iron-sulfur cluster assembly transcriptional regulator
MFGYGKMSGCAVAAVSALAEVHPEGTTLSSLQIAQSRNLSQPLVAKVLTLLSQHGIVHGTRGPGGGYRLARDPTTITVLEIVELFEGHRDPSSCPFGPGWCGVGAPCPLHDTLVAMSETAATTLRKINFAAFIDHPKQPA